VASERRFLAGFGGYLWGEMLPWLGWRGLLRLALWTGLANGLLYLSVATKWDPGWITLESLDEAILVAVGPIVGERRRGTAAWVASQPISRGTYIVGKVVAHGLGVAVSMVIVPGLVAYWWLPHVEHARGFAPPTPSLGRYLVALGVVALLGVFLVALVVMLGTFLRQRSAVTGLALIVVVLLFFPVSGFGWSKYLPGMLLNWLRPTELSTLAEYIFGNPLAPMEAVWVTALAVVAFTGTGVLVFRRSEF
jgi:ABC-type transport system involved in multi-copper enzyme maturation permease subunit